jgi:hypothetical protein
MLNDTEYASAPVSSRLSESASEYVSAEQTIRLLREKVSILENALADKEKIIRLLEKDIHS